MLCFLLLMFVQIVLESFPVSSSGHVALFEKTIQFFSVHEFFGMGSMYALDVATFIHHDSLRHFLHGPTVFVIAFFFCRRWFFFFSHIRTHWQLGVKLIVLVGLADSVTAVFYFLFKRISFPFFSPWVGFIITGGVLGSLYFCNDKRYTTFTLDKAFFIGLVQGIALLPGISRLAVTFALARWLHLSRKKAFEVSFLVQWPLIAAAFFNSISVRALYKNEIAFSFLLSPVVLITLFSASLIAFFSLWFLQWIVYKKKMWIFSVYLFVPTFLYIFLCQQW